MTLLQLQKLCERIGRQMTSADIPLKMYNYDIDLELELQGENGDYWVDVKLIPDAKQFQQMLCEKVDYEVKIKRDIHLESQTQSSIGDIKI
jgi:hypothetical protein